MASDRGPVRKATWRSTALCALLALLCSAVSAHADTRVDEAKLAIRSGDDRQAMKLLEGPAQSGDAEALYMLSNLYRSGRGVTHDPKRSLGLLRRAAEKGHARACYSLGDAFQHGRGVEIDRVAAAEWFTCAARGGDTRAKERLAGLRSGRGDGDAAGPSESAGSPGAPATAESLRSAIQQGDAKRVQAELAGGAPADYEYADGARPLHLAIERRHAAAAVLLIRAGADPNQPDRGGRTPLMVAVRENDASAVKGLLAHGASVDVRGPLERTALMMAVRHDDQKIVRLLLEAGADPNLRDEHGDSAMVLAASAKSASMTALLEKHGGRRVRASAARNNGATVRATDRTRLPAGYQSWPALSIAAWRGHQDEVRSRLASGARVDEADAEGLTALGRAAWQGHREVVAALLAAGANPNGVMPGRGLPLSVAAGEGHGRVVSMLLAAGAVPDASESIDGGALLQAVRMRQTDIALELIRAGANLSAHDEQGISVLEWTVRSGDARVLGRIAEDPTIAPLPAQLVQATCVAIGNGADQAVKALLAMGVAADSRCANGRSLIAQAAAESDASVIASLLAAGADPNERSGDHTPLHLAAHAGHDEIVTVLIDAGADPNARGLGRMTPLMFAAREGHLDTLDLLVGRGADMTKRDEEGRTARDLAEERGQHEVATHLDDLGRGSNRILGLF